nr:site-specific integrase [Herbaspirillum huttiense]
MGLIKRNNTANWYYQFQVRGKKYLGSTGTSNKTKAMQVERELRNKIHAELFLGQAETITLAAALKLYLDARKNLPYHSGMMAISRKLAGYKLHAKTKEKIPCYGLPQNIQLHELQTRDIERLVQRRKAEGDAPATMKHEVGLIRSTMKEMIKLGYRVNREIIFPTFKTTSRVRYLDEIEEAALLRELNPETLRDGLKPLETRNSELQRNLQDNYDIVIALLDTGCRYSEIANIPWSAVDIEAGTIHVYRSKVSNEDRLYMTARLRDVFIRRHANKRPDGRYVFENKAGKERGYSTQAIKKAIDRAGLNAPDVVKEKGGKVTAHVLRHSYASKLVKHGVSLFEVSVLLGHSDPKMTQRYAHLAPNDASRKAVGIIDSIQAKMPPSSN